METNKCSKCGEVKPVRDFSPDKCTKNGLNGWCKKCRNTWYKEKQERS